MLSEIKNIKEDLKMKISLNPCYNGICSLSHELFTTIQWYIKRLNPCYNGICSLR